MRAGATREQLAAELLRLRRMRAVARMDLSCGCYASRTRGKLGGDAVPLIVAVSTLRLVATGRRRAIATPSGHERGHRAAAAFAP